MASAHVGFPGIVDRPQGHRRPESGQGPFPGPSVVFRLHCPLMCDALHKAAGLTGGLCSPASFPCESQTQTSAGSGQFPSNTAPMGRLLGCFTSARLPNLQIRISCFIFKVVVTEHLHTVSLCFLGYLIGFYLTGIVAEKGVSSSFFFVI